MALTGSMLLHSRLGDDVARLVDFASDLLRKLLRRSSDDAMSGRKQPLLDLGSLQHPDYRSIQCLDDRGRRPSRRKEGVPLLVLETRQSAFGNRRHIGQLRHPLPAADAQDTQAAVCDMRRDRCSSWLRWRRSRRTG